MSKIVSWVKERVALRLAIVQCQRKAMYSVIEAHMNCKDLL